MVAKLIAEEGDLKGLVLSLEGRESWVIGRDPEECQLVIEDPQASRRHLIARLTPAGITVENLSTTNPTQINEEEIGEDPHLLQQGDTVRVGNEVFRFYTDTSAHVIEEDTTTPPFVTPSPSFSQQAAKSLKDEENDTIFGENEENEFPLAEINFGLTETGRWLLKVVGGPNNGAEFYMQANHHYLLGTDPHSCDIVFHDTSVSRQHARITVTSEDHLFIEDLKSRNGVFINGQPIESKQPLIPSSIVALGTTSFVVYDREGEMQTIISPLLPSIVKVLQKEEPIVPTEEPPVVSVAETKPIEEQQPLLEPVTPRSWMPIILISLVVIFFALAGLGTVSLFKSEPVVTSVQENADELIKQALAPFPAVKYTFNKNTGGLLLLGHVATSADKNQLLYNLQGLKFIKAIDDTGIIIDEGVWQEINSVLIRNPAWRGITVHSPAAGQFILSGYLQTRNQAEQLSDYMSVNFPYLDLLKKQVVVEEDILNQINVWLQQQGLRTVTVKMSNGEMIFSGSVPLDKMVALNQVLAKTREIPGVRIVNNFVKSETPELGVRDLTGQYEITGQSRIGNKYTVVINGRILSEEDVIDGMKITAIKPNVVLLERDGNKYRIDYK